MADATDSKPLASNDYHGVVTGNPTNTSDGSDLGEPVDLDGFYSPAGTLNDVQNDAETGITTKPSNKIDLQRVLFMGASMDNNKATPTVTAPTEVNKCPEKPMEQPELFRSPPAKNIARNIKRYESRFEEGYDSNGSIGPFYDAVAEEGEQDFDDDVEIPEDVPQETAMSPKEPPQNVSKNISNKVPTQLVNTAQASLTESEVNSLTREQLKAELKKRGGTVGGNKSQLREWLNCGKKSRYTHSTNWNQKSSTNQEDET